MPFIQTRECDGKCCEESPRWPTEDGCQFLVNGRCEILAGKTSVPEGESPIWPGRSGLDVFNTTCRNWPQNTPGKDTGGCCWNWIDDGS